MDAHHHPVRQTMVTGTNLEKQLPIFPCSDPKNTSMGLYIYIDDTVLSFTTYFAWHWILSTHDQIPWMIKNLIFLNQQHGIHHQPWCTALPCIPVFCTQQLPQHMRFTTNLVNTKQTQWSKLTSFVGKASSWPPHCLPSSLSSRGTCATGEASKTQHHTSIISKTCGWIWSWFIFTWISPWQVAGIPGRFPYYFPACLLEAPSPDII